MKGAINIPLEVLKDRMYELDRSLETYIICKSGVRSAKALDLLQEGLPKMACSHIPGGMDAILKPDHAR